MGPRLELLYVCSANICRSPVAEHLTRQTLADRGIDVVAEVSSAGFLFQGREIDPRSAATLSKRGIDAAHHRSRILDAETAQRADLIVAMTARHVLGIVDLDTELLPRTYLFAELVALVEAVGPPGDDVEAWRQSLHAARDPRLIVAVETEHDVDDPHGRARRHYERTARQLDELTTRLVGGIAPSSTG